MGFDPNRIGMDLILGLGAFFSLVGLVRGWREFVDDDFTAADRRVAMQVSVFLIPPIVVLLHELGHAAAAVAVGAEVGGIHYGLFEGSVTVLGDLTPLRSWFVALSGNLVSAVVALALIGAGVWGTRLRRPFRYLLVLGGVFEFGFSLVGYPLLSLTTRFGDWLTIYDFEATPGPAWASAVVHGLLLYGMWRWWKGGLRRTLFAASTGLEAELHRLEEAVARDPADAEKRLALANLFAAHGELELAGTTLDDDVAASDDPARLHLARARLAMYRGHWNQALLATRAGLEADAVLPRPADVGTARGRPAGDGNEEVRQRLWANQGLALTQLARPELALAAFENVTGDVLGDPKVRYCRGVSRLATGDVHGARADLAAAVAALPPGDWLRQWAEARLESREPAVPDDSDRPNWQRRQQAPPPPITGV
ncbi:MAG TPA: tetratricopeptide repeat protein [Acidimicrobiales bacterium]|nr:tetratricopeptide repeat protein [Acidimicrobiales bacterium]